MTTCAAAASTLEAKAPDPSKHVNYTLGMVLGVDDFNQEFAYVIGRSRWQAREALGYGTLTGLRVTQDVVASKGPRILVTSGTALTPCGHRVCVSAAQCAYLNEWLAANEGTVSQLLGSPVSSTLTLYLTLAYRDCPVDLVPIPGEPCRTEDELMKPSRLVDDFVLDLKTTPPDQREEDLLREFVVWLRMLAFGGGGPYATLADFADALRNAVQIVESPPSSPLSSPLAGGGIHFNLGSPLTTLRLDPLLATEYYRVAFRVWSQEIRPRVHALCCQVSLCCSGQDGQVPRPDESLLLARVDLPVLMSSGHWVVDDTQPVVIDESRRPTLLHLRLLQELVAPGLAGAGLGAGLAGAVVAAGIVGPGGARPPVLNGLAATKVDNSRVRLTFGGYVAPGSPPAAVQYVVKALPLTHATITNPVIRVDDFAGDGIVLAVVRGNNGAAFPANAIDTLELSVEITRLG